MNNNTYWNSPGNDTNPAASDGNGQGVPRSGGLLRQYSPQPPQPSSMPSPQGWPSTPSQISPMPSTNQAPLVPQNQQMQQMSPAQQQAWMQMQGGQPPSAFANAVQTVRHWSGKFTAARTGNAVDPNPLVIYRPGAREPLRRKPWKRSRSVRVSRYMRRRRVRWQASGPGARNVWKISLSIFAVLLVILLSSGVASAYAYYQSQIPRLQGLANQQVEQSSRIYDRNGKLLYVAYDGKYGRGTPISYDYLPGVMQDAMIAAEDKTFWSNTGIDPQGILRAASEYASTGSVQSGGSTITQQVIKNLTHDTDVSLQRKIPEAALAIGLTQQYPKWKILEMYFNVAPFGAQELGVEAAVEDYFGLHRQCDANFKCIPGIAFLDRDLTSCKNANDLNTCKSNPLLALARASLLAGMPQNPPAYDPTINQTTKNNALIRQDYVLNQMMQLGMNVNLGLGGNTSESNLGLITPAIIQQVEALTQKIHFVGFKYVKNAPHFVDWVIPIIEEALGNGDGQLGVQLFTNGGFNIRTTLDLDLETYIEKAVYRHLDQPEYQYFLSTYPYGPLNKYHNVNDAAVVVENAKDGEILAMDGSANYGDNSKQVAGQFNAALAPRQPGSSFKPIVYATAFQMGWYPGIVLPDRQTYFPSGQSQALDVVANKNASYAPHDYGGSYNNKNWPIQLDIANSFNIPALKTLEYAGLNNVVATAQRLGITTINDKNAVTSMALGSLAVPLVEMVGAYQTFANQGYRTQQQGVLDIWDNYGNHLYHFDPSHVQGSQVISPQISYLMTSMLTDETARAYEFAGDHVLSMWDWPQPDGSYPQVAAKTGTTDSFVDNWTIGYTSSVVVGVWSGNADNTPMDNNVVGITGAAPIWHDVIERVSGHCNQDGIDCGNLKTILPAKPFSMPSGLTQQQVNTVNGLAGNGYLTLMLNSDAPMQTGLTTPTTTTSPTGTSTPTASPTP